ncbi:hypothetical protein V2J09_009567 [Rumex salicifolius]
MGTKLQLAIDVLATKSFVTQSEKRDSMERAFEKRSIEAVKKTMLKQEETFKQQVMELHSLYRVQRLLMEEMKNEITEQKEYLRATAPSSSQGTVGIGHKFSIQSDRDEHKLEISRSCSSDTKKGEHSKGDFGFDFGIIRPTDQANCSVIMAGSSRISGVSHTGLEEDLCGVDLTLSIGGGVGGSKNRLKESQLSQSLGLESSEATKSDQKSQEEEASLSVRASSGDERRSPWGLL